MFLEKSEITPQVRCGQHARAKLALIKPEVLCSALVHVP
jgi:hypothetical protein